MAWSFGLLKNLRDFIQAYFQFGSIQPSDMTWHRGIWKTMAWSYKLFQNLRDILGGKKFKKIIISIAIGFYYSPFNLKNSKIINIKFKYKLYCLYKHDRRGKLFLLTKNNIFSKICFYIHVFNICKYSLV